MSLPDVGIIGADGAGLVFSDLAGWSVASSGFDFTVTVSAHSVTLTAAGPPAWWGSWPKPVWQYVVPTPAPLVAWFSHPGRGW